jgi:hypothetical protein
MWLREGAHKSKARERPASNLEIKLSGRRAVWKID